MVSFYCCCFFCFFSSVFNVFFLVCLQLRLLSVTSAVDYWWKDPSPKWPAVYREGNSLDTELHSLTCSIVGTCESAVCVRIESFQLQRILIIKISNYKWSKRDAQNYTYSSLQSSNTLNYRRIITHIELASLYSPTVPRTKRRWWFESFD